ncbi:MAG: galactose mutarotase [Acidobacteriaceae bacterium]|nr:galactose mutarotase [Acidobacteriaceae bacterium]
MSQLNVSLVALLLSSAAMIPAQTTNTLNKQPFGKTADGQEVYVYTLRNSSGVQVKITNFGGRITSILAPDKNGKFDDVVLGFDSLDGYLAKPASSAYFGAVIGRYANRLAHGTFTLDGKTYHIPTNDGPNTLHGGTQGFDSKVWDAREVSTPSGPALELHYLSPDGQEGFPGNLNATVRYSLDSKNGLRIDYSATTDKDTVLNLTNHSYFNLEGAGSETILNEYIMLGADQYTPVDGTLIPTGKIDSVAGTPLDFRKPTVIGSRINDNFEQLKLAKGYDHNFVLSHPGDLTAVAALVVDPTSGRALEVHTTQPGIQFYTGNFLNGEVHGIGGVYRYRSALCLETQHFPNSPNQSNFPTTVLHPGETFHSTTIYRFLISHGSFAVAQ